MAIESCGAKPGRSRSFATDKSAVLPRAGPTNRGVLGIWAGLKAISWCLVCPMCPPCLGKPICTNFMDDVTMSQKFGPCSRISSQRNECNESSEAKRAFFNILLVCIVQGVLDRLVEHFVEFASEPVIVRAALLLNLGGIGRRDDMSDMSS